MRKNRSRLAGRCWPVAAQLGGGGTALVGLYLLVGLAVTLLVGGLIVVAVGALREAKVI